MIAGGLILLGSAVIAVEVARLIAGFRRAVRLNRALHELRRPLQSIALTIDDEHPDLVCAVACLEQARFALEELDAAVNRRVLDRPRVRTAAASLAEGLADRWRFAGVSVSAPVGGRELEADPAAVGAALDNLVANAIEHGGGTVSVRALPSSGAVRFEVRDEGGADASASPPSLRSPYRRAPDPRRGHGLAIAAESASAGGGTLIPPLRVPSGGTVAAMSLPAPPAGATPP